MVASDDGLDEISVSAPTQISELKDGQVTTYSITPEALGLACYPLRDVAGGDATQNAAIIRDIFSGQKGAARDIVLANTAAVLYVAGVVDSLREGVRLAAEAVASGKATAKLNEMVAFAGGKQHVS